jgi:hypothetical protein
MVSCTLRVFDGSLRSRMPLIPTPARLKLEHVCDQWHSSRVFTPLTCTGRHSKLRRNTAGTVNTKGVARATFAPDPSVKL